MSSTGPPPSSIPPKSSSQPPPPMRGSPHQPPPTSHPPPPQQPRQTYPSGPSGPQGPQGPQGPPPPIRHTEFPGGGYGGPPGQSGQSGQQQHHPQLGQRLPDNDNREKPPPPYVPKRPPSFGHHRSESPHYPASFSPGSTIVDVYADKLNRQEEEKRREYQASKFDKYDEDDDQSRKGKKLHKNDKECADGKTDKISGIWSNYKYIIMIAGILLIGLIIYLVFARKSKTDSGILSPGAPVSNNFHHPYAGAAIGAHPNPISSTTSSHGGKSKSSAMNVFDEKRHEEMLREMKQDMLQTMREEMDARDQQLMEKTKEIEKFNLSLLENLNQTYQKFNDRINEIVKALNNLQVVVKNIQSSAPPITNDTKVGDAKISHSGSTSTTMADNVPPKSNVTPTTSPAPAPSVGSSGENSSKVVETNKNDKTE